MINNYISKPPSIAASELSLILNEFKGDFKSSSHFGEKRCNAYAYSLLDSNVEPDDLRNAMSKLLKTHEFYPSLSEIKNYCSTKKKEWKKGCNTCRENRGKIPILTPWKEESCPTHSNCRYARRSILMYRCDCELGQMQSESIPHYSEGINRGGRIQHEGCETHIHKFI